jgi:hypothetical protein
MSRAALGWHGFFPFLCCMSANGADYHQEVAAATALVVLSRCVQIGIANVFVACETKQHTGVYINEFSSRGDDRMVAAAGLIPRLTASQFIRATLERVP